MASHNFTLFFLLSLASTVLATSIYPSTCHNTTIKSCNAFLYQHNDLLENQISALYDVEISKIKPINGPTKKDYLVSVPCFCENVTSTVGYFRDTVYQVQPKDTLYVVSNELFSGQVWEISVGNTSLIAGENVTLHLLCGCDASQNMVTYTVQEKDTLQSIATLLSSDVSDILYWNPYLGTNLSYLEVGWVMYVPMGSNSSPAPKPSSRFPDPSDSTPLPVPGGPEPNTDTSAQDSMSSPCIFGYLVAIALIMLQFQY